MDNSHGKPLHGPMAIIHNHNSYNHNSYNQFNNNQEDKLPHRIIQDEKTAATRLNSYEFHAHTDSSSFESYNLSYSAQYEQNLDDDLISAEFGTYSENENAFNIANGLTVSNFHIGVRHILNPIDITSSFIQPAIPDSLSEQDISLGTLDMGFSVPVSNESCSSLIYWDFNPEPHHGYVKTSNSSSSPEFQETHVAASRELDTSGQLNELTAFDLQLEDLQLWFDEDEPQRLSTSEGSDSSLNNTAKHLDSSFGYCDHATVNQKLPIVPAYQCPKRCRTGAFRSFSDLEKHMKSCQKILCPCCKNWFLDNRTMRRHQRSLIKPYVCVLCLKTFGRSDTLLKHTRQQHPTLQPGEKK
jgi:hypothetical protein